MKKYGLRHMLQKAIYCIVISCVLSGFCVLNVTVKSYAKSAETENFTWDNATVYFAITDRFYNGNTENDHSYGRSLNEVDAEKYETRLGTFHGGDLEGLTQKIKEGYFDELGVNAIWFTAPYEQIHGAICSNGFKYYAYHGYYPLDFTQVDENMGTEEDLKEFVDTAHEHGIRVVMDVVLNHVGYADPVTATTYGFGEVSEEWKEIYYNTPESEYKWYMDYSAETKNGLATLVSEGDWSGWWGNDWIRAVTGRHSGYSGSEQDTNYQMCLGGLPDIKTENADDNGIPAILQTKWKKEGRLEKETEELDTFFETSGLPRRNVNYVIKWLTDYVREYGIDGFRCDSVKHVELEHWGTLKEQAEQALEEWRQNNSDNIASDWDEDFWMTGENFDFNNKKDKHFTIGGFDSMVNLQFQGKENYSGAALDYTYSTYAKAINSTEGFNMLTYISSHDMGLGGRSSGAGTALLLCPGGVQIYYGDESGRKVNGISGEQGWRTHMNWDSMDNTLLEHYKKVGTFRKKHPAIAMGGHKEIMGSPYTFSRIYRDDKVVVCMPEQAGKCMVKVGSVFEEGEWVKDVYSGAVYQVAAGSIDAVCDENRLILLEGTGKISSCVGAKLLYEVLPYTSEMIQVQLFSTKVSDAEYSINGADYKSYHNGDTIRFGGGAAYGEVTTLLLRGKDEKGVYVEKEYSYTKCDEPTANEEAFSISVKKSEFESAPNCYVYSPYGIVYGSSFPGNVMKDDGEYWVFSNEDIKSAYVILSLGDDGEKWRSTPELKPGILVEGRKIYSRETGELEKRAADAFGKVTVNYESVEGEVLKTVIRKGYVGTTYKTSAATINGYRLAYEPENMNGIFTKDDIVIKYVYKAIGENVEISPSPETIKPFCKLNVTMEEGNIKLSANIQGYTTPVRYMFSYEVEGKEYLITNFQSKSEISWKGETAGKIKFNLYVISDGNINEDSIDILSDSEL